MKLDELRKAVREFVPLVGLKSWKLQIRFVDSLMLIEVSATVPDRITGIAREIMYRVPAGEALIETRNDGAREYVRKIVHDFVLHEADESIGFRKGFGEPRLAWFEEREIASIPAFDPTIERPFDPHAEEQRRTGT